MGSFTFVVQRIVSLIPVVIGITIITFFLIHLIPGDPVTAMLGNHYTPQAAAHLRQALGLDKPLWTQYLIFMGNLAHGNLGQSVYYEQPVTTVIFQRVEATVWLVIYGSVLAAILAVPLGIISALKQNSAVDQVIRGTLVIGLAMPSFWLGVILILVLSVDLGLFPVTGFGDNFGDHLYHLFLPALTIALGVGAILTRSLRNSILEVAKQDYVRTARAKGLRGYRVIVVHILRNALLPTVTIFGVNIAFLISSTVIIENVFAVGGIGQLLVSSILQRDYTVVQGIVFLLAIFVVLINLLTDIVYALLDPRISYS